MPTCLVGFTPDAAGQEALGLARSCVRERGGALVVCVVVPEAWGHPSLARLDVEYASFLSQHTHETLEKARALLGDLAGVRYIKCVAGSASTGLMEAARQENADLIVVGSARSGASGRIAPGGVASELMHTSELPVAISPRDFMAGDAVALGRLTCAYSGLEAASGTVLAALGLATALEVPLRLVSFAVRDRQMYPSMLGHQAEKAVTDAWREQALASLERVQKQLMGQQQPVEIAVAVEESWDGALGGIGWQPGELLVLGSSRLGVLKRVFLGSNASKIIRASPVPVVVLPRAS